MTPLASGAGRRGATTALRLEIFWRVSQRSAPLPSRNAGLWDGIPLEFSVGIATTISTKNIERRERTQRHQRHQRHQRITFLRMGDRCRVMNVKFVKGDWGGVREQSLRLVLAWPDVARRAGAPKNGELPKGLYKSYDNSTNITSIFPGWRHCANQASVCHERTAGVGDFLDGFPKVAPPAALLFAPLRRDEPVRQGDAPYQDWEFTELTKVTIVPKVSTRIFWRAHGRDARVYPYCGQGGFTPLL